MTAVTHNARRHLTRLALVLAAMAALAAGLTTTQASARVELSADGSVPGCAWVPMRADFQGSGSHRSSFYASACNSSQTVIVRLKRNSNLVAEARGQGAAVANWPMFCGSTHQVTTHVVVGLTVYYAGATPVRKIC